jgi:hypothetical protein
VEQYLIFAEGQAMRRIPMQMTDWVKKLDGFLTINDREILNHAEIEDFEGIPAIKCYFFLLYGANKSLKMVFFKNG